MPRFVLVALSVLLLVASIPFVLERVAQERENREVLVVLDWDDIEWFARTKGVDPLSLAEDLRKEGFTVFGFSEWSLKALRNRGVLVPVPPPDGAFRFLQYFSVASEAVRKTVVERLQLLGKRAEVFGNVVGLSLLPEEEEKIGLGWDRDILQSLKERGFSVILRPYNYLNVPPQVLSALLAEDVWRDTKGFIASGDSILGYGNPESLRTLASFLREEQKFFGYVEFVGQKGEDSLARLIPEWTLRVHSIPPDELKNYTPSAARDRFLRALKERSVRVLYVRLFAEPSFAGWEKNLEYLRALRQDIEAWGFVFGYPSLPHKSFVPPRWLVTLYAAVSGIFLALALSFLFPRVPLWLWVVLGAFGGMLTLGDLLWAIKVAGLLAGIAVPTLAVFVLIESFREQKIFSGVVLAFLVSFAGVCIVAQGMYHWLFVLRVEQYFGVKVTLALPPLLVLLYLFRCGLLRRSIQNVLLGNLKRFEVLVLAFLGVALTLYLMRSGNFPLLGAGELESRMRVFLERVLFARPRTKEFLIGYPALWLLVSFRKKELLPVYQMVLWLGVTVGFVTFFNSFCHLHTPLLFILLRFANAFILSFPVFFAYLLIITLGLFLWRTIGRWGA